MTAPSNTADRAPLPSEKSTNSYWHKEPSKTLLGLRSTKVLPANADVVIVGSGIAGAFAAWELLKGGDGNGNGIKSLVMLEAREACWGATGRNGGHCQPNIYIPPPHISHWELSNFTFLRSFISRHNIPCDWQDTTGVHGFYNKAIFDVAVLDAAANAALDPDLAKLVKIVRPGDDNGQALQKLRLGKSCVGAIVQEKAASLWPYKLVCFVLETLLSDFPVPSSTTTQPSPSASTSAKPTFNIQTHTPLLSLSPSRAGSGMGFILHTALGQIHADEVLLCTNGHTSHLLPSFTSLIVPVRGQMSALRPPKAVTPPDALSGRYSYGFVGNGGHSSKQDDYLVQRPWASSSSSSSTTSGGGEIAGGELMFGGGRGAASAFGMGSRSGDDSFIDSTVASYLRTQLNNELALQPPSQELTAEYEWTGIMGYSRDGHPWVGEVPGELLDDAPHTPAPKGLYMCAGFTGHGMANAALAARWVAQSMRRGGSSSSSSSTITHTYGKGETGNGDANDVEGEGKGGGKDKDKDEVKMPREFVITKERAEKAMGYLAVEVVDLLEDDLHL